MACVCVSFDLCRYEKYLDTTPLLVSTGDGFLDAYNVLLERVQDLQLVRAAWALGWSRE